MNHNNKIKFLKNLNEKYNYDNKILEFMNKPDIKICDGSKLKKIQVLDSKNVNLLMDLMKKTVDFLEDYNIVYWLDSGTLLGACRNNKFIPWDDDVDLAIPYDSYIKMKQIIKTLPKVYIDDVKYRVSEKYKIKFTELASGSYISIDVSIPFLMKTFHLDGNLTSGNDIFIHLLNYFPVENKEYISNSKIWRHSYVYPFESIYPLVKLEFEGRKYWSVNNPELFLNNSYWFWKDLALAGHSHFKYLKQYRNKKIYFTLT